MLKLNVSFAECQDLIAQCLRIEASERILLEDILRHPWMTKSDINPSSTPSSMSSSHHHNNQAKNTQVMSLVAGGCHPNQPLVNSVTNCSSEQNQHKPSLNSVGSCVSSSTDEGSNLESPQHRISKGPPVFQQPQTPPSRLRAPNSAPQVTLQHPASLCNGWIVLPAASNSNEEPESMKVQF